MQPTPADHLEQIARHSLTSAAGAEAASYQLGTITTLLRSIEENQRETARHMPLLTWCAWIGLALLAVIAWR